MRRRWVSRNIRAASRFAQAYFAHARARIAKGEFEAALSDLNRGLELDPRYAEIYSNRGMIWLRLGPTAEPEADFNQTLALKPDMDASLERRIKHLQTQLSMR